MDVHTTGITPCCLQPNLFEEDVFFCYMEFKASAIEVKRYLNQIQERYWEKTGEELRFICCYEASCMGHDRYHGLTRLGIDCVILAPTSMPKFHPKSIKTNKLDSEYIDKCLAYGDHKSVYVPDVLDEHVRDYLRMRNDAKDAPID